MNDTSNIPHYKVAIVGGGVTGLYCARRLANQRIGLFEGSDRWGGRVETVLMGDKRFKAEYGPMRFEHEGQVRLMTLLRDLKLSTSPFPAYQSAPMDWPKYNITDKEEQRWTNPMDLLLMGILRALGKYTDGMSKEQMSEEVGKYNEASYPELRKSARQEGDPKGELLYTRGLWNVLGDVLSHQAVLKIRDTGNFYHVIHENPNAIEWIIFWLRAFQPKDYLVGIKGGSSQLTTALEKELRDKNVPLHGEHRLTSLRVVSDRVHLAFQHKGKVVQITADHVLLTLPRRPIELLAPMLPDVGAVLDTVRGIPLLKCFFVVSQPWWNEETPVHTNAAHMPAREVHYYQEHVLQLDASLRPDLERGKVTEAVRAAFARVRIEVPVNTELERRKAGWWLRPQDRWFYIADKDLSVFDRKGKGMVMVYTDRPASEYWNQFVVDRTRHDRAELRKSQALKLRFVKYLSEPLLANLAQLRDVSLEEAPKSLLRFQQMTSPEQIEEAIVPLVEDWGIHDWEHEPYGGAFHIWRPGVQSWEVMERLAAFGPGARLHIAGEAWSDYQGFIEGCLNSAELALKRLPTAEAP